ncbi:MAG: hypothetical protein KDA44_17850 [Planctomycetales bacterium]|nr:hypothetical protein [Planctomycetales bacterium]
MSSSGYAGYQAGAFGQITVLGEGSTWHSVESLDIGVDGSGILEINGGGSVRTNAGRVGQNSGSMGQVTVNGLNSRWSVDESLSVGNSGHGMLTISQGGALRSQDTSVIGDAPGSTGQVSVDGAGTNWELRGEFLVGREGIGSLTVSNGGYVMAGGNFTGIIGDVSGSSGVVMVDGSGSTLTNTGGLMVGRAGTGTLSISNRGTVSNQGHSRIGVDENSIGWVTVEGEGSVWNSSTLYAGISGRGNVAIAEGGSVRSEGAYIGYEWGAVGDVTVSGANANWTTSNYGLYVGRGGNGTLNITSGGEVSCSWGAIGSFSSSSGKVRIHGAGSKWNVRGVLDVGGDAMLNITDGGLLTVDYALTISATPRHDNSIAMASGGMLAIPGDVDDSLTQFLGFVQGNDAIRYWNPEDGHLASLTDATYGDDYTLEYLTTGDLAGYTMLTVTAPGPTGDFDGDFDVDGGDFLAWQRGESPTALGAADLADWQANFGAGAASANALAATPEPSAALLAALALTLGMVSRAGQSRGRRRS